MIMDSLILKNLIGEQLKSEQPEQLADNVNELINWIKNPLNKIKVSLYKESILITGKTFEFKEDIKKFFNAKFNSNLKGWLVFSNNLNFNELKNLIK
jgi:hypothetical protein